MSDFNRYADLNARQGRRRARDDVRSGRALSAEWQKRCREPDANLRSGGRVCLQWSHYPRLTAGTMTLDKGADTKPPADDHLFDQAGIKPYANGSGDNNRLHLNPAFANSKRLRRIIAHAPISDTVVCPALRERAGDGCEESGCLLLNVVAPGLSGSEVADRAKVKTVTEGDATCNAECWIGDRLALTDEPGARGAVADG